MQAFKFKLAQKQGEWSYLKNSHFYWEHVSFCRYSDNISLRVSGDDEQQTNNEITFRNIFMSSIGREMSLYEVVMETNSKGDDTILGDESQCTRASIKQFTKDYNKQNASKSGFEIACHCFITKNNKYIIALDDDPLIYYNVYDIDNDKWIEDTAYAPRYSADVWKNAQNMLIDDKIWIRSNLSCVQFYNFENMTNYKDDNGDDRGDADDANDGCNPAVLARYWIKKGYSYANHGMFLIDYKKIDDNRYHIKIQLCGGGNFIFTNSFLLLNVDIDLSVDAFKKQNSVIVSQSKVKVTNKSNFDFNHLTWKSFSTQYVLNSKNELMIMMIGGMIKNCSTINKSIVFYNCQTKEIVNSTEVCYRLYISILNSRAKTNHLALGLPRFLKIAG